MLFYYRNHPTWSSLLQTIQTNIFCISKESISLISVPSLLHIYLNISMACLLRAVWIGMFFELYLTQTMSDTELGSWVATYSCLGRRWFWPGITVYPGHWASRLMGEDLWHTARMSGIISRPGPWFFIPKGADLWTDEISARTSRSQDLMHHGQFSWKFSQSIKGDKLFILVWGRRGLSAHSRIKSLVLDKVG